MEEGFFCCINWDHSFLALFFHKRRGDNGHFVPSFIPLQFAVHLILLPITQCYKKQGVVAASGWIHLPSVYLLFSPARLVPHMSYIHPLNWEFYFSLFCVLPLFPVTICGIKKNQAFVAIHNHVFTFCTIRIIFRRWCTNCFSSQSWLFDLTING